MTSTEFILYVVVLDLGLSKRFDISHRATDRILHHVGLLYCHVSSLDHWRRRIHCSIVSSYVPTRAARFDMLLQLSCKDHLQPA